MRIMLNTDRLWVRALLFCAPAIRFVWTVGSYTLAVLIFIPAIPYILVPDRFKRLPGSTKILVDAKPAEIERN